MRGSRPCKSTDCPPPPPPAQGPPRDSQGQPGRRGAAGATRDPYGVRKDIFRRGEPGPRHGDGGGGGDVGRARLRRAVRAARRRRRSMGSRPGRGPSRSLPPPAPSSAPLLLGPAGEGRRPGSCDAGGGGPGPRGLRGGATSPSRFGPGVPSFLDTRRDPVLGEPDPSSLGRDGSPTPTPTEPERDVPVHSRWRGEGFRSPTFRSVPEPTGLRKQRDRETETVVRESVRWVLYHSEDTREGVFRVQGPVSHPGLLSSVVDPGFGPSTGDVCRIWVLVEGVGVGRRRRTLHP